MILQDRKEREKGIAKNAVEAYVYEMRGKLFSELEKFITEEVLMQSFLVWGWKSTPHLNAVYRFVVEFRRGQFSDFSS